MNCINDIFTKDGLLEEKSGVLVNKTGIFNISSDTDIRIKRIYINFASRLGVEITGIQQPLTGTSSLNSISFKIDCKVKDNKFTIKIENNGIKISANNYKSLEKAAEYMTCMFPYLNEELTLNDLKQNISENIGSEPSITEINMLSNNFEIDSICININGNQNLIINKQYLLKYPQNKNLSSTKIYYGIKQYFEQVLNDNIVIDENCMTETEELLFLSLRIALENFEVCYPICSDKIESDKKNIIFKNTSVKDGFIELENNNIIFTGEKFDIGRNIKNFVYKYGDLKNLYNNDLLVIVKDILNSKNDIGQIVEYISKVDDETLNSGKIITKNYCIAGVDESKLQRYIDNKFKGKTILKRYNDEKEIFRLHCNRKWEGTDFIDIFTNEALPQISDGDVIEVYGVLSEDLDVRCQIENIIRNIIQSRGGVCSYAKIYRSLKSGISWIEETVLPKIESFIKPDDINEVIIKFKNFVNEFGEESYENESTPNYQEHQDNPNKWFDIPTRWLQELFPVDEIISKRLNIPIQNISFESIDDCFETYCIEILNKNNTVIYEDKFNVKYVQKNYMNRYPQIGKVHVTTGWITVKKNGETILDKRIITDTEKIWSFIEDQILPKLEVYFFNKYGRTNLVKMQPLFNKLQINIKMSEVDYNIGVREERISTTESMQEDIYFYILDWFKTYGERDCGGELDNIGLIIPEIVNCKGEDSNIEIILYDDWSEDTYIEENNIYRRISEGNTEFKLKKISFKSNDINLYADVICENNENTIKKLSVLQELIDEKIIDLNNTDNYNIHFKVEDIHKSIIIKPYEYSKITLSEEEKQNIIDNEIISYKKYLEILSYYRKFSSLKIQPIETTFQGRKIYSVEIIKRDKDIIYSDNKLKTNRITCIYNARHHGNEASGTNSSFMLIDKLLKDEIYKEKLNKINVIMIPYENIDGGEIHYHITKDNPKWLCHVARYNSTGYEFRKDYTNPDSKYGEAKALVKLWKRWLPDLVTDNHGFEGHELYMQFSGYISPWYKSFWIPRALYYGYIWYNKKYIHMKTYGEKIQDAVTKAVNNDKEIRDYNECFAERFYKYAEKWFPEMFNTEKYNDVIFYWIESSKRKRASNFSLEFPEITTIDWTTEVADETATGNFLKLNSRAHLISDIALLDLMYNTEIVFETDLKKDGKHCIYSKMRVKPLK